MKNTKLLYRTILLLAVIFSTMFTFACKKAECENHFDEDKDGFCEECGEPIDSKKNPQKEDDGDYDISSISIAEYDLSEFVIAANKQDLTYYNAAKELKEKISAVSKYDLEIVDISEADDLAIIVRHGESWNRPEVSFRAYQDGRFFLIESEYDNAFLDAFRLFVARHITTESGEVTFEGMVFSKDISTVRYSDFGAVGDGKTNDFKALKDAHDYANLSGQTVKADVGATYYISDTRIGTKVETITISTNVDWGSAKFIIDDTDLSQVDGTNMYKKHIFTVAPDKASYEVSKNKISALGAVGRDTKKLNLELGHPAMLNVFNSEHRVYVRYGANADDGVSQQEIVLIDKDGNISEDTPFLLDYDKVTSITAYYIDDTPITIEGGIFTTRASRVDTTPSPGVKYTSYFARGMTIKRSNTTVKNVQHYITGEYTKEEQDKEGLTLPSYRGFFTFTETNNCLLLDCVLSARRGRGTYGLGASYSNNFTAKGCTQSNFYLEDGVTPSVSGDQYWGVAGTNLCKNLTYEDCELTRFDAHKGLYNGKIINSKVAIVNLTGGGDFLIEDSEIIYHYFFRMRTDYGATFRGTVTIKDTTLTTNSSTPAVCAMLWTNHDFGYGCYFPNIELDNIKLNSKNPNTPINIITMSESADKSQATPYTNYYLHTDTEWFGEENKNVYTPPERIELKNSSCYVYVDILPFFEKTEIINIRRGSS